jgi:UDP-N-acetylmuramyl pentapeptide phosphotransferase/UDP-N-acetylglucosamine-1-phosphate transferase
MLGKPQLVIFGMAMVGALLGFLRYNFTKDAKIIMGDTGSLTLGLFVAILCIEFIEINAKSFNPILKPSFVPVFSFTILIIPLFDTLRVFIVRIWNKKSPFHGDRNHIHHFLVDSGMSHLKAAGLLFTVNITLIIMAYSLQFLPSSILLVLMLVMAFILSLVAYWNKEKKNLSFYLNRIFLIKRS